jgi:hypothetical protein
MILLGVAMKDHKKDFSRLGERTRAVHAGEFPDPFTGASPPNLVMSTEDFFRHD